MVDQSKDTSTINCDLCDLPAMYHLCQDHLDDQTGNDEYGKLAVQREKEYKEAIKKLERELYNRDIVLNLLYQEKKAHVIIIDTLKQLLSVITPYISEEHIRNAVFDFMMNWRTTK